MYFFVFPLILLVASTICASPVPSNIETYGLKPRSAINRPRGSLSSRFRKAGNPIDPWSIGSDVVVQTPRYDDLLPTVIKQVDLSKVVVTHDLINKHKQTWAEAQEQQIYIEMMLLKKAELFLDFQKVEGNKPYIYIEFQNIGVPSNKSSLTLDQKKEARKFGIDYLAERGIVLDPDHDMDRWFTFWDPKVNIHVFAIPMMLRDAKLESQ